jgi:hypothetical protein
MWILSLHDRIPRAVRIRVQRPARQFGTPASHSRAGEGAQGSVAIKFYRNGFVVDDGELRKMDDPANRSFLEDINAG